MSLKAAAIEAGIGYRTAARWVHDGLIQPIGYRGKRGVEIPCGEKEKREFKNIKNLRAAGIPLKVLRKVAPRLRKTESNPFLGGTLVVVGNLAAEPLIIKAKSTHEVLKILNENRGQIAIVVPLEERPETAEHATDKGDVKP